MAFAVPDPYKDAIRRSLDVTYTVDASYGGSPVVGATGLQPTGGSITDATKPGVRRVLNLDLAPERGLYDLLAPIGTTLTVTAHVRYPSRQTVDIPMGLYDVDSEKITEGGGGLSLTAPDLWVRIQRAKLIQPLSSVAIAQFSVVEAIAYLITGALGASTVVNKLSTNTVKIGAGQTWEKDREKAILDLAASIGVWVYFDRGGVPTIADVPTIGASADWMVDAGMNGVLTSLDRQKSRTDTRNVIVVESSASASGATFPTQIVFDTDPSSPTYAGTDPLNHPELAGPFGVVSDFLDISVPMTAGDANAAGRVQLAKTVGLASQVSLGQVPNPAVDAFDVLDVLPPGERTYRIPGTPPVVVVQGTRALERHVVDTVTHSFMPGTAQTIDGRSIRTTSY